MCFATTCCYLWAIIFFLSHTSLPLAKRHTSSGNRNPFSAEKPPAGKARPLIPAEEALQCNGPRVAILPPSLILPKYMLSVRAMMRLQILPDGTINGTFEWNQYADLNIEIVGNCMVRIKGVASQRYLVMEKNGLLTSQTEPDKEKSFFRAQLERSDFYAFKNGNHFIAFNHRGRIKKIRADENGRSTRKSTLFVLVNPAVTSDDDSKKLFGVDLRRR